MENINQSSNSEQNTVCSNMEKSHCCGKISGGVFIVIIGSLFLTRELGVALPEWLFTWKTFLIGVGITVGIKHNFKHAMWFFLILIGATFLIGDLYPDMIIKRVMWPILISIVGVVTIMKPRSRHKNIFFKHDRNVHWKGLADNTSYTKLIYNNTKNRTLREKYLYRSFKEWKKNSVEPHELLQIKRTIRCISLYLYIC